MLRLADASLGDYYTDKEFRKLSQEQRAEYCAELARQDSIYKEEMLALRGELDQSKTRSLRLRKEGDSLFALGTALESRAAGGGAGTAPREHAETTPDRGRSHVVRRGESLWAISKASDVYGSGAKWRSLYEANRARIRDPNLIYPGQELSIPR